MARRVLFILLSLVVFASAVSTGFSYYQSRYAASTLRDALILKAKVGAVVEEAERKASQAQEFRQRSEKQLTKTAEDLEALKKSRVELEKKVTGLEAQLEEQKIGKTVLEESLRAAEKKSLDVQDLSKDTNEKIKDLESQLSKQIASQKKFSASAEQLRNDLEKERELRKAAVKAQSDADRSLQKIKKELDKARAETSKVSAELTDTGKELARLKKVNGDLETALSSERNKTTPGSPNKSAGLAEITQLRDKLKAVSDELDGAKKTIQDLKSAEVTRQANAEEKNKARENVAAQNKDQTVKVSAVVSESVNEKKSEPAGEKDKAARKENTQSKSEDDDLDDKNKDRARLAQEELKRVGCYNGRVDGVWGKGSLEALNQFSKSANLGQIRNYPTEKTIELLKSRTGRICTAAAQGSESNSQTTQADADAKLLREQCFASCVGPAETLLLCREKC